MRGSTSQLYLQPVRPSCWVDPSSCLLVHHGLEGPPWRPPGFGETLLPVSLVLLILVSLAGEAAERPKGQVSCGSEIPNCIDAPS
jgi:hypothetical protein